MGVPLVGICFRKRLKNLNPVLYGGRLVYYTWEFRTRTNVNTSCNLELSQIRCRNGFEIVDLDNALWKGRLCDLL